MGSPIQDRDKLRTSVNIEAGAPLHPADFGSKCSALLHLFPQLTGVTQGHS